MGLGVALLMGCSQPNEPAQSTSQDTSPESTSQVANTTDPNAKQYLVMVNSSYSPYSFRDERGNPAGFDVELMRALAEKESFSVDFVSDTWANMAENIDKNDYDLVMTYYPEECDKECQDKYNFSNTYLVARDVVATRPDLPKANTLEDLKSLKVAMIGDSSYLPGVEAVKGKDSPDIIQEPSEYLAFQAFVQGKADTLVMDKAILEHYLKAVPDFKPHIGGQGEYFSPYDLVILVKKTDTDLLEKINTGIEDLVKDGTYQKIYGQWFEGEPMLLTKPPKSE